jgi:hypothetical protein
MDAGDKPQHLDSRPMSYLDEQGRYLPEQRPPDPPDAGDEVANLLSFLERQRATFAWKCGGLDAAGLRATVGASSLTLGGMLKHLARFEDDMSTEWLHGRAAAPLEHNRLEHRPQLGLALGRRRHPAAALCALAGRRGPLPCPIHRGAHGRRPATAEPGHHERARHVTQSALHLAQHDRGVRAAQRPCRSHPGVGRRARRARSPGLTTPGRSLSPSPSALGEGLG